MRATCLVLFTVGLVGCGEIDSSKSTPVVDRAAPSSPRADDAARAPATPADDASRRDGFDRRADARTPPAGTEPDNTAKNVRDTDRVTRDPKLPIDQKENQTDIDITAKIRRRVVDMDGLSVNARNAKIITSDGKVTLRGPVENDTERETLARIAREVAGEGNVDNQLEVKSANTSTTNPPPNP
jgi:hypothetical protein